MRYASAVFLALLLSVPVFRCRADGSFEPGEWVWCDAESDFVAAPHGTCPALGETAPFFCEVCEGFYRPETPERPHVHVGQAAASAVPAAEPAVPAQPQDSGTVETNRPAETASRHPTDDDRPYRSGFGLAAAAVAAAVVLLVLVLALGAAKRKKRSGPVRRRRIPWRWKDGVPQGLELLPGSLVCQPASAIDGGTAMVYDAMFLDEEGWVPAVVKRIVGKGMRQIDRFPVLRFEASVLEKLAGIDAVPRLFAGPVQDGPVGAERWSFYAMSPATGRLWPECGGLGRDTRLALHALCEALEKMHERGVGHHDLKPQNVFWNPKTKSVAIIDFGSAVFHGGGPSNPIGATYPKSEPWVAPASDGKCLALLSPASDAWVYGLMFCEALVGGIADRSRWPENKADLEWFRQKLSSKTTPAVADAVADGLLAVDAAKRKSLREFRAILEREWDL